MALPDKALPYGLRDVKVTPLNADGTAVAGAPVDLPASQTFSFSESEDFQELRGDDRVQANRGSGPTVDWGLDSGGISLEAYQVMNGGTIVTTGISPNVIKRYRKLATDSRPYFKAEGQAINDNGGDFHCIVYRCKADGSMDGSLADQTFWVTSASGKGYGSLESANLDVVYDFIHNETAVAVVGNNNELQGLVIDATGGTFTLTYSGQTTSAIVYNPSTAALTTALEALSNIAVGEVLVTGAFPAYQVEFKGTLGNSNVTQMVADDALLTGQSSSASVYTIRQGG